jgi:predicted DNA-binding protein (MmcQ/YjbR family)
MMQGLICGVPPSKLFRMLQDMDSSIDARNLGYILMTEYPRISPAASMSIRKWQGIAGESDFPDEQIDGLILHYLKDAGYIV